MSTPKPNEFDLIIVGGGLVGASLACALAGSSDLRIAVVEAHSFNVEQHPGFDARTVALAAGSQQIFAAMGLWAAIEAQGVTPIQEIHVSDRGHAGSAHLDAAEQGLAAMGYVAEIRILGAALSRQLEQQSNVTLLCPASVKAVQFAPTHAKVVLRQDGELREITSALVVAADGGDSFIRNDSGIATFMLDYHQSALISNVAVDRPHRNIAYERFTDSGPMALLPMRDEQGNDNAFALVWTLKPDQVETVQEWDETIFLSQLQERFGERAGYFTRASQRHLYPLKFLQTREHVRPRLAVIGNAAHTLHPVAGQGFNLGLRDVAVLSQVLSEALTQNEDIGELNVLRRYAQWRRRDHLQTSLATDGLVRLFSNNFLPLAVARNLGLTLLDILPPLKKQLVRHAMGYVGKLPRLGRGLKL
ncbi:2-octaprenyl-6-methoxyphenyl hydroxylase [Thiohalophilus sp.]|uniref:2-octaprenyl-6-methoxyphenyl hydroxylase n=1 Tax=Thiohalophilus sp. TaxID=3028392 RepID=UPI003976A974